jgi:hypothetical protein
VLGNEPLTGDARQQPPCRRHGTNKLNIPIGPTGILVGSALHDDKSGWPHIQRDDLVMLPLTDPLQLTRITMDTSEFYVRQQLIRAAATGERIAISRRRGVHHSTVRRILAGAEARTSVCVTGVCFDR